MTKLEKWVLEEMLEKLPEYEGTTLELSELDWRLFESENINGSYYCSTYRAEEWIKEQDWDDIQNAIDNSEMSWADYSNPISEPEKFQVQIILTVASYLVSMSNYVMMHWDDEITMTPEIISIIEDEWTKILENE